MGLWFHGKRAKRDLDILGVRVLDRRKGKWGRRKNVELGAMVALGRRWREVQQNWCCKKINIFSS